MAKRERRKEGSAPLPGKTSQRYVVAECEIRRFVGNLGILDVSTVAARFQIIADLSSGAFEEGRDQLSKSDLALINRIVIEDSSVQYRRLVKAIIVSVGQGRHGINAAHLTASRVVELAFRCTREYFSALHSYRRHLRLRLLDQSSYAANARRRSAKG